MTTSTIEGWHDDILLCAEWMAGVMAGDAAHGSGQVRASRLVAVGDRENEHDDEHEHENDGGVGEKRVAVGEQT